MRGSPLIRALLAFCCILALGYPIWKLTEKGAASESTGNPTQQPQVQKKAIRLQLSFTAQPSSFKVLHLGEEVWNVAMPAQDVENEIYLEFPKEGIDLQFDVDWSGDGLSAMKVVLIDPEGNQHVKSIWGQGSVSEVLTFP